MNKFNVKNLPGIVAAATIIFGSLVISKVVVYEYSNPKLFAIELGLAVVLALILFLFPLQTYQKILRQPLVWGIGLFLFGFIVSTVTSIDITTSLFGNIDRGTGLFFIAIVSLASISLGATLTKEQARKYILLPISITGVLISLSIYIEQLGWKVLSNAANAGFLGNSSSAGTYLLIAFFVSLYLFLSSGNYRTKWFYGIAMAITLINTVFINFSFFRNPSKGLFGIVGDAKGATIAIVFGLMVALAALLITSQKKIRKTVGIVFLIAIIVGITAGIVQLVQPQSRLHNWFVAQETDVRFIYWNIALKGFGAHPLIGTGPETYGYTYQKYFDPIVMLPKHSAEIWSNKPHNAYLETLSERGIIGSIGYIALLVSMIVSVVMIYKNDRDRKLLVVISGLVGAYMVNNLIYFDTITSYLLLFMVMAFIISAVPYKYKDLVTTGWMNTVRYTVGGIILVGVTIIVVPQIIKTHRANREFTLPLDQRMSYYQKVENTASYGSGLFIAQRADFYYESVFSPNLNLILQQNEGNRKIAADAVQGLVDTLQHSFQYYPKNEQGELAMGKLASIKMVILNAPNEMSLATMKSAAQDAIVLSPTNPNGYLLLGQEYVYEQKYNDAYTQFEKARSLEVVLPQAQFALINLAGMLHDQKRLQFYIQRAQQESPEFKKAVQ